jgi:hypothetical protein
MTLQWSAPGTHKLPQCFTGPKPFSPLLFRAINPRSAINIGGIFLLESGPYLVIRKAIPLASRLAPVT